MAQAIPEIPDPVKAIKAAAANANSVPELRAQVEALADRLIQAEIAIAILQGRRGR